MVSIYLVAPTALVVLISFGRDEVLRWPPRLWTTEWYGELLASSEWTGAAIRSLLLAVGSSIGSTVIGTLAAIGLVRGRLRYRRAIETLALGPMILPTIVMAAAGYSLFTNLHLSGSYLGLGLMHVVLGVPFVVLIVTSALVRTDPSLELAAMSMGASRSRAFRDTTLPIILPAALSGGLFAFLTSFDEVVIAIFLVSGVAPTLPSLIISKLSFALSPVVAAVSALQVIIALLALGILGFLSGLQQRRARPSRARGI